MEKKSKISVEIPIYLKKWIDAHDVSQNALVTLGLRKMFLEEQQVPTAKIEAVIINTLKNNKLPF
jgi:hypothetical protein